MSNSNKLITLKTLEDFNEKKTKNIFYDKTTGNTVIKKGLAVEGEAFTVDLENLTVKDNIILTNSDGTQLTGEAGFVVRTGSTETPNEAYGITYNPAADGVRLGLGTIENGTFDFEENQAQFVATRADEIPDGSIIAWDDSKHTLVKADLSAYNETISDLKAQDTTIGEEVAGLRSDMEEAAEVIGKNINDVAAEVTATNEKIENTITNDIEPLKTEVQMLLAILKDELVFDCGGATDIVVATLDDTILE
jgi:hypothetical protein